MIVVTTKLFTKMIHQVVYHYRKVFTLMMRIFMTICQFRRFQQKLQNQIIQIMMMMTSQTTHRLLCTSVRLKGNHLLPKVNFYKEIIVFVFQEKKIQKKKSVHFG